MIIDKEKPDEFLPPPSHPRSQTQSQNSRSALAQMYQNSKADHMQDMQTASGSSSAPAELPPPYSPNTVNNKTVAVQSPIISDSVNELQIHNRREDVRGTYYIDSTLPIRSKSKSIFAFPNRKNAAPLNASFRSRKGAISINLATKGPIASRNQTKAIVQAATKRGDIEINIHSLQPGKHISLDARSKNGNVIILIPRNYCGAIQLRGHRNRCKILPALKKTTRILQSKDDGSEVLMLVGDPTTAATSSDIKDNLSTDYCQLSSRHGFVSVGYFGEDKFSAEGGFFKKLGQMLFGGD